MTPQRLWIPGPLPGLNELIGAAKGFGGKGIGYAKLKESWTTAVWAHAKNARLARVERVKLQFLWVEKNRKRDPDNVAAGGRKLVLDGLVKAGVLPGDGWEHVAGWVDAFEANKSAPGVWITIVDVSAEPAPVAA